MRKLRSSQTCWDSRVYFIAFAAYPEHKLHMVTEGSTKLNILARMKTPAASSAF